MELFVGCRVKNIGNHTRRYFFAFVVFALAYVGSNAQQVTADVRMSKRGRPVTRYVSVTCDALDSTFHVVPDTAGRFQLFVPCGRCLLSSSSIKDVILDLQNDTSIDVHTDYFSYSDPDYRFRSRYQKDSITHVKAEILLADIDGMDSTRWPAQPKYFSLVELCEWDLYYPLPQWRTFSLDTVLKFTRYCYFKDPQKYESLYYTIRQLEHRLGLKPDCRVRAPRKPDSRWYAPMPELKANWIDDTLTCYSCLFERARDKSKTIEKLFSSQGEPSLVYPCRKGPAVRMLIYGGLGGAEAYRIEGDRFYYCASENPIEPKYSSYNIRWSAKLTSADLDTLARCLDTLRLAGDEQVLNVFNAMDAETVEIEFADSSGYHIYRCDHPSDHLLTAPLDRFFGCLFRRNVCRLSVPVVDAANGRPRAFGAFGKISLDGHNCHIVTNPLDSREISYYLPKGKYTLHIKSKGFETHTQRIKVKDDMMLDTIRLQHQRVTLCVRLNAEGGSRIQGPVALYVDGVDTAMLSRVDNDQTVTFHNVPAASYCYLVEKQERVGGWYHSQSFYTGNGTEDDFDDEENDSRMMYLDYSRPPFRSRAEKDSSMHAIASRMELSGVYLGAELGALYYYDAMLKYMPMWQTFPDADSLAYDYLRHAYHHDPQQYGYLYYPIQHLTKVFWRLKKDKSILRPFVDSTSYLPLPEELLEDYHVDDLLTPFAEAWKESARRREVLAPIQEPSLFFPKREKPAMRWMFQSTGSGYFDLFRIDGDTLYIKSAWQIESDEYDTLDVVTDTFMVRKYVLTNDELNTLERLLESIDAEGYSRWPDSGEPIMIGSTAHFFEYVLGGCYHSFYTYNVQKLPPVNNLRSWILDVSKKK